ncbi:uncharacterized protein RCC_06734 [Ramularia collo-cygni]|uniref:Nephrocystin 3-like N-terminal domain-containing protein n=1 Tax=Ramularia collo-cygni TaxID=112498 RepID=A0A2D3VDJ8_9PEZI|nr:uncharacterized protein RCC_06734 [Ramularia collo-cygni]CZT20874.1 uncharacterized protein RCC_06734 [Ramularia collo-cygni]
MSHSPPPHKSPGHRLLDHLHRLRPNSLSRLRSSRERSSVKSTETKFPEAQVQNDIAIKQNVATRPARSHSLRSSDEDVSLSSTAVESELAVTLSPQIHIPTSAAEQMSPDTSVTSQDLRDQGKHHDVWSAAFRDAVRSLSGEINVALLENKTLEQIFTQLDALEKDAKDNSMFLRGVKYLTSIQVPLKNIKMALDLASPLASFDPTANTVFGIITGVTAIAISFASADLDFAKQVGEMLNYMSYIDECDTLGQRANNKDNIHKALVSVYRVLLEFYQASFDILKLKGVKIVMKTVLVNNHLPDLVADFLKHTEVLHKIVQNATADIINDIKLMLYDQQIARWLGGDKVERQSEHHGSLASLRADDGCDFLLKDPKFVQWYRSPGISRLVILGDMGTGKSVVAAFAVDKLHERRESRVPRPIICYHYCRDDETGRMIHILSVLLLSLLQQLPGLKRTFHEWYMQNQASGNIEPVKDARKLGTFLENALGSVERPLFVVIDGLDECDRLSRSDIIDLLGRSSRNNPGMKFLLLSRRNEEILQHFDQNDRIDLVLSRRRDRAIVSHTVERQLNYLSNDLKELVIERLSSSAKGSAIWIKMVTNLLEDRHIQAPAPMRLFLDELPLPSRLSGLFERLFQQYTMDDLDNQNLAGAALKALAASSRPLSTHELAWAAALATAPPSVSSVDALADLVDERRILKLIAPFISWDQSDDINKGRVQLSHQSVKEYIIQKLGSQWPGPQMMAASKVRNQPMAGQWINNLDAYMLRLCIKYLLLDDINRIEFFSEDMIFNDALPGFLDDKEEQEVEYDAYCTWDEWEKNMIRYDPTERGFGEFFVYASCHWVDHFGVAEHPDLPALRDIEALCSAGSTRLHNWTQQNCRPGCIVQARFEFRSKLYDPLGITSLYGSETMLHHMIKNSDFSTEPFLSDSAIAAAEQILRWGDLARLKIIVSCDRARLPLPSTQFWELVVDCWTPYQRHRNWDAVFSLIDDMVDNLIEDGSANQILREAAGKGCSALVQRLMAQSQNFPELWSGSPPIMREGEVINAMTQSCKTNRTTTRSS